MKARRWSMTIMAMDSGAEHREVTVTTPAALERPNPTRRLQNLIAVQFAVALLAAGASAIILVVLLFNWRWTDLSKPLSFADGAAILFGGPVVVAGVGMLTAKVAFAVMREQIVRAENEINE